jgi:hypothetical protein
MPSPDRQLIYINPTDLHDHWPLIKTGLEEVKKRSKDVWIPEDVYSALRSGASTLHIGYDGEDYDGFVVLNQIQEYDGARLFIWIAYGAGQNVVAKYMGEIEQMARRINAKGIRLASSRKGWCKYFTPITTIYEKEI